MRALLIVMLLAGCAHAEVGVNSGTPPPAGAAASVHVSVGGGVAAAVLLGAILAVAITRDSGQAPPPQMSPDRSIDEHDCTKPIEPRGNLRCR